LKNNTLVGSPKPLRVYKKKFRIDPATINEVK
jgi:hypothetical protein